METFGERLKYLIKHSDLKTNKSFCERTNFSEQALSRLISGKNNPSYDFIMSLAIVFPDIDLNWLIFGRDSQSEFKAYKQRIKDRISSLNGELVKHSSNPTNPRFLFTKKYPMQMSLSF